MPYINNPFGETISGYNKIKGQNETMKPQNEKVVLRNNKNLINELNRLGEKLLISKKCICIIVN